MPCHADASVLKFPYVYAAVKGAVTTFIWLSPFVLCGHSSICERTGCYIRFFLIGWCLKLIPPGVSPPTADMTVSAASAAQRRGTGVDA